MRVQSDGGGIAGGPAVTENTFGFPRARTREKFFLIQLILLILPHLKTLYFSHLRAPQGLVVGR